VTAFNYTSGNINNLDAGDSASMTDIKGSFQDIPTFLNGRTFNEDNLPVSLLQKLGLSDSSGQKGRGKSIIIQSESRSNTAYGTLTTPDQVSGIVLPTDGLIAIGYQATWQESVNAAARAALFIGANQLKLTNADIAAPVVQETGLNSGGTSVNKPLATSNVGLVCSPTNTTAYTGDVTTGQVLGMNASSGVIGPWGGFTFAFAAAGTYTVSVQFKASSGSVTASNRKLWVWTIGF